MSDPYQEAFEDVLRQEPERLREEEIARKVREFKRVTKQLILAAEQQAVLNGGPIYIQI